MNKKSFVRIIAMLFVTLLLAACNNADCRDDCDERGQDCKKKCGQNSCIAADNWGYPTFFVPASPTDGLKVSGTYPYQSSVWLDTEQILIDENIPLVVTVNRDDKWTSWYGGEANLKDPSGKNIGGSIDAERDLPKRECYYVNQGNFINDPAPMVQKAYRGYDCRANVTPGDYLNIDFPALDSFADCSQPCWLKNGLGLYIGFSSLEGADLYGVDAKTYHIPDHEFAGAGVVYNSKPPVDGVSGNGCGIDSNGNLVGIGLGTRPSITSPGVNITYPDANFIKLWNKVNQCRDGFLINGEVNSELKGNPNSPDGSIASRDRIFFKINDNYYSDNYGGYTVNIKSGSRSVKPGPVETVIHAVTDPVVAISKMLYNGIILNSDFVAIVRVCLVLYIVVYGMLFIIGGIREAKKHYLLRILKICTIVTVLSPTSWQFFYDHLFGALFYGISDIAALLLDPFGSSDFDPLQPWYSVDSTLHKFWSTPTWMKILSTIFSNTVGILFFIVLLASIMVFTLAIAKFVVTYVTIFIVIAMLITLFPIFVIFLLFQQTRSLFTEWGNQFIVFGVQLVLLMAAIGMFSTIIVMFLERTIGYTVCYNVFFSLDIKNFSIFHLLAYMPDISNDFLDLNNNGIIDAADLDGNGLITANETERYYDLPYFHPVHDADLINKYRGMTNFLSLADLAVFLGSTFLMWQFYQFIPRMASAFKGGSGTLESSNIFGPGNNLWSSMFGNIGDVGGSPYRAVDSGLSGGSAAAKKGLRKDFKAKGSDGLLTQGLKMAGRGTDQGLQMRSTYNKTTEAKNSILKKAGINPDSSGKVGSHHVSGKGLKGAGLAGGALLATGGKSPIATSDEINLGSKQIGSKQLFKTDLGAGIGEKSVTKGVKSDIKARRKARRIEGHIASMEKQSISGQAKKALKENTFDKAKKKLDEATSLRGAAKDVSREGLNAADSVDTGDWEREMNEHEKRKQNAAAKSPEQRALDAANIAAQKTTKSAPKKSDNDKASPRPSSTLGGLTPSSSGLKKAPKPGNPPTKKFTDKNKSDKDEGDK